MPLGTSGCGTVDAAMPIGAPRLPCAHTHRPPLPLLPPSLPHSPTLQAGALPGPAVRAQPRAALPARAPHLAGALAHRPVPQRARAVPPVAGPRHALDRHLSCARLLPLLGRQQQRRRVSLSAASGQPSLERGARPTVAAPLPGPWPELPASNVPCTCPSTSLPPQLLGQLHPVGGQERRLQPGRLHRLVQRPPPLDLLPVVGPPPLLPGALGVVPRHPCLPPRAASRALLLLLPLP